MKVALDTNVLVYAEGLDDEARRVIAVDIIERLARPNLVLPVQVLGEFASALRRKAKLPAKETASRVRRLRRTFARAETTAPAFDAALDLWDRHGLQPWDAVIIASSAEAGCSLLLSEDMQDGFRWGGLTVANPFADTLQPLLHKALRAG